MCAEMTSKVGVAQKFRARDSVVLSTPPAVNPGSAPELHVFYGFHPMHFGVERRISCMLVYTTSCSAA